MRVLKIALPAVGEMFLYMMVWVVDTAFVGNYGANEAVSAVGFSSEVIYTTVNMFIAMGISIGITTMVAQSIGAGDRERAERYLSQGLLLGTIIAFALAFILGSFSTPILKIAGVRGEVLIQGSKFMKLVSIGTFFNMVNSMLNSGLRGTGNTVTPLIASVIINVVAIFFDWILIFGRFGIKPLGVMGSAIATSLAYFSGFIYIAYYYKYHSDFKLRIKYFKNISREYLLRIVRLAIPSGLQEGAFSISRIVSISFIMYLGTMEFAANQITTTIESISFMPGWGFAVAATTLVGQQIGAKNFKMAREYAYISAWMGIGIMLICSVAFLTIPDVLMRIFIKEDDTIQLGRLCLMVAAFEQPFMALSMVLGGALKGAGDTKTPFIFALISSWVIRVPLMYYVIFILKLGVVYVWVVTTIQFLFEGMMLLYMFNRKSRRWEENFDIN